MVSPDSLVTVDHFVPHVSTVPANAGQTVGLHVRQKVLASRQGGNMAGRVVLCVHGRTVPSVPAFDLDHKSYSWMAHLAQAGFNVYAMDLSGYGGSPRPMMDDPCNVNPAHQHLIVPRPLAAPCAANYECEFNTIRDDWREIDTVVDRLRRMNKVERVHLIGWSAGGPRAGGYAAQHPEKVDRMVLFAPAPTIAGPIPDAPAAGFPLSLQTREDLETQRWDPDVRCEGQLETGVRDAVWAAIMQWDRIGASWAGGVMRERVATRFGWTRELAGKVVAPTLVVAGEFDRIEERRTVHAQLGSRDKVFLNVACGSHFMLWEKQRAVLHAASLEWLLYGRAGKVRRGTLRVDGTGGYVPESAAR